MHKLTLFIFRRDLRLEDNTGLIAALKNSSHVLPCFIFDPRQCDKNTYKSLASIQFMLESLKDLQATLKLKKKKLFLFYGSPEKIIENIIKLKKIDAVYFNTDYTPFSQKRDEAIMSTCKRHQVIIRSFHDALLNPPQATLKADQTPYQVFSHFYKNASKLPILNPQKNSYNNYYSGSIPFAEKDTIFKKILPQQNNNLALKGGRKACLEKLSDLSDITNYTNERDYPDKNATSHLSAYLKFTTCSIREVYYAIKQHMPRPESILRELYWRDFFTTIAFYFPHVFGQAFKAQYNNLSWQNNKKLFTAWCEGKTGFPIVDAGMRELNETGLMHNRVRLITASFLIKDLLIDWRWGELYFAQNLIDYDPAVNNGNWQWVASTGTDAQPYFRIFNPWLQQKKFDPDCHYIKKWVPELKNIDKKIIHNAWKTTIKLSNYPKPIVDHSISANIAKKLYSRNTKRSLSEPC
jgi:deoxyribodipyrimidine photo-lyase